MNSKRARRRGKGSLQNYQTKAGTRWRFQIWVPIDPYDASLGTRKYSKGGFTTSNQADDAMRDALSKRDRQEKLSTKTPDIATYTENWLNGRHDLEESTRKGYRKHLRNHVLPYLGRVPIDRLTPTQLSRHYRMLLESGRKDYGHEGEPLSPNTVRHVHVLLGSMFSAAIEDGYLATNPAKRKSALPPTARDVKAARPEAATWNAEQLRTALDWLSTDVKDEHYALWHVLALTGMRRSEALALRWSDINPTMKRISIKRAVNTVNWSQTKSTKTQSTRVIDIDDETLSVLSTHKASRAELSISFIRPEAFVFANDQGGLRSPDSVTDLWSRRRKKLLEAHPHLPRVTLHGLRHTHATILMELDVHPKVVQERLGHSTITTTLDIYSHVTPTVQRAAAERFAGSLSQN